VIDLPPVSDIAFLKLILQASLPVQIVLGLLLGASLLSWWYIFVKLFALRGATRKTTQFERAFWSGDVDMNSLYQQVSGARDQSGELARIFESGFREFVKLKRQTGAEVADVMEGSRRAMRAAIQRDLDRLEAHLAFLATVGSVSPYVGLFGTVWGIMNAFQSLANVSQATLAQVAPGIAEALLATAMGLFAAIPAVIAYNSFTHDLDRLATRFESFMEEFSNILQRQAHRT
jgi:biopolymer transport protein TolQ